ncbi:ABC transporter ATP-binding protein [Pacificibacter maritimus]|uniref:ABC transporter ATP-binding protein n=1 Tax=Pacificibacter maritimus TaxID=762213 RepID=UPI000F4E86A0|nr:ABC transporter ATP-binding protein [Pacificibacter maritimus]
MAADEAVSALDVSVAAQNINLLQDMQDKFDPTYLFIPHDLGMVEHISGRIAVMYLGRNVEMGRTDELLVQPRHPYTEALLSAVPQPDPANVAARSTGVYGGKSSMREPANGVRLSSTLAPMQPRFAAKKGRPNARYSDDRSVAIMPKI